MGMRTILQTVPTSLIILIEQLRAKLHEADFKARHRVRPEDFTRDRQWTFPVLMLFVLQKTVKSIQRHLHEFLDELAEGQWFAPVTAGAVTHARAKLQHTAFIELNQQVVLPAVNQQSDRLRRWHGHWLFGHDSSLPRLPDGKRFGMAEQIERLTAQLAQKPDDPALLRARGLAAVNLEKDEQAVEDLTKFLEKNPGGVLDRHSLAVAQARLGRKEAATQSLEEITKRAGDSSTAAYSRAVVGAILGQEAESLAALEEAVKAHANDSGFLYDAACAYALVAEHAQPRSPSPPTPLPADGARGEEKKGESPEDPDRVERIAKYKARAIELLVLACDAGYSKGEHLRTDTDLESLWLLDGFRRVLGRLGADRRYATVWAGTATAVAESQPAGPAGGAEPGDTATDKSVAALVESVETHGLDAPAHLVRGRELVEAGYRLRSLAAVGVPPLGGG